MNRIFKYEIQQHSQELELPVDSKILTIQNQGDSIMLWAIADESKPKEKRTFLVLGTGFVIDDPDLVYLATIQVNDLVWHVFEER